MEHPLRNLPGFALRRAASAMMAEFGAHLEPLKLRISDASALLLIKANPGLTASQLGRLLDIQRANMVPLLARIETAALIERKQLDGKSHSLGLTALGKIRVKQVEAAVTEFETALLARIPEPHRDHLKPALDALWLPKTETSR
jgi:DNA-binding MarR family transcriptional regulator